MLNLGTVTAPVVALPALTPHVGEGAQTGVVVVAGQLTLDGELAALSSAVEAEAVGKRLARHKGGRIEIDAPLDVAAGGLHEFPLLLAHRRTVAIECTHDVDFLIHGGAVGGNELKQDAVGARLKLLALVVKDDVLVLGATGHHARDGQQRHYQTVYIPCFHIYVLL